jgi:SsrA-binding protein
MSDTPGIKIICDNRKAYHNYSIEEKFEAGLVLKGTEVKALRDGKANIGDAYAIFKGSDMFLVNSHISPYMMGNRENHEPLRTRKLLMHREEMSKLWGKIEQRGYNLVPLKLYFKNGYVKVEIGLGKGKKAHDKRASTKEKEAKRELSRVMKKNR